MLSEIAFAVDLAPADSHRSYISRHCCLLVASGHVGVRV